MRTHVMRGRNDGRYKQFEMISPETVSLSSEWPRIAVNRRKSAAFAQHTSFLNVCVRLRMVRVCEIPNFISIFQS